MLKFIFYLNNKHKIRTMIIHEIMHPSDSFIFNGDIISESDYLLIDEQKRIFRNHKKINLSIDVKWPIGKIISDDSFILIDGDTVNIKDNAWIIHNNGTIKSSFFIGNATDIILTKSNIVASYSKCELNTNRIFARLDSKNEPNKKKISSEGLAVFDFQGNCLFKFMSDAKDEDFIPFMEIDSFLKIDEEKIYLIAQLFEGNVSVLEFNLKNYSMKKILNLSEILGEKYLLGAMSLKNNNWYFLGTKDYEIYGTQKGDLNNLKSYLLKLNDDLSVELLGECCFSCRMQGNSDGSFSVPSSFITNQKSCYIKL